MTVFGIEYAVLALAACYVICSFFRDADETGAPGNGRHETPHADNRHNAGRAPQVK